MARVGLVVFTCAAALCIWLNLCCIPGAQPRAWADHDEVEHRLKAAGVDPELRQRVHASILRAVEYLAAQQDQRGEFPAAHHKVGVNLLCTLALRHAGTPASFAAVDKAQARLFGPEAPSVAAYEMERDVYTSGLGLMVLHALGRKEPEAARLVAALARGLDPSTGWWGYTIPAEGAAGAATAAGQFPASRPNLSTSQFAALGLGAAARLGIEVPPGVWRTHAKALLAAQVGGDFGYWPAGLPVAHNVPYLTGTAMGVANLLLARNALTARGAGGLGGLKLDAAIQRGLAAFRQTATGLLAKPEIAELWPEAWLQNALVTQDAGFGLYYTFYAVEKACIFADLESLGGKRWYPLMADWLVKAQEADGGWASRWLGEKVGGSNVVESALALLILVRSPQANHPTTPRAIDGRPRGAVTDGPAPVR